MLKDLLQTLADLRTASIVKSHHEFGFFADILGEVRNLQIVYVYRRPSQVMLSYGRFLHTWPWNEGPKAASALEFANARPSGALMRYQLTERTTMLDRWAAHVAGWIEAAERYEHVHAVRYEDLDADYERTILDLGERLGAAPIRMVRPPHGVAGVQAGPEPAPIIEEPQDRRLLWLLASKRHPRLMHRLGYADPPPLALAG
jgi:hypothetical protein